MMHDHLLDHPEPGDWQDTVAHQLATLRGMPGPGGNEFFEAAEIGTALSEAGYALVKRTDQRTPC